MNVVGVNGSGRTGGNTSVLVRAVLEGAREAGAQTAFFELADFNIAGCRACDACRTGKATHRCVVKDDMQKFYGLAAETDVWVLGSPIYLDHITAQMMAFIQRTYCYIGPTLENYWPRRNVRTVLAITYEARDPDQYDTVLDWMEKRMKGYHQIPTVARFKVNGTRVSPIIDTTHPEVQRAQAFGRSLQGPRSPRRQTAGPQ